MKYTTEVTIARLPDKVLETLADSRHYSEWMDTLVSQEVLEGEPGQVGTKTRLSHKMGRREVAMVETITQRDDPRQMTATYEADGVWNQALNRFEALEDGGTRWVMETEFRCKGVMWLMTKIMPSMFKRQTEKTMNAFKTFIESSPA